MHVKIEKPENRLGPIPLKWWWSNSSFLFLSSPNVNGERRVDVLMLPFCFADFVDLDHTRTPTMGECLNWLIVCGHDNDREPHDARLAEWPTTNNCNTIIRNHALNELWFVVDKLLVRWWVIGVCVCVCVAIWIDWLLACVLKSFYSSDDFHCGEFKFKFERYEMLLLHTSI